MNKGVIDGFKEVVFLVETRRPCYANYNSNKYGSGGSPKAPEGVGGRPKMSDVPLGGMLRSDDNFTPGYHGERNGNSA